VARGVSENFDQNVAQTHFCQMGDQGFVLIDSGITGDQDALYFFEEKKPIFSLF
jgi:hypothetical protein